MAAFVLPRLCATLLHLRTGSAPCKVHIYATVACHRFITCNTSQDNAGYGAKAQRASPKASNKAGSSQAKAVSKWQGNANKEERLRGRHEKRLRSAGSVAGDPSAATQQRLHSQSSQGAQAKAASFASSVSALAQAVEARVVHGRSSAASTPLVSTEPQVNHRLPQPIQSTLRVISMIEAAGCNYTLQGPAAALLQGAQISLSAVHAEVQWDHLHTVHDAAKTTARSVSELRTQPGGIVVFDFQLRPCGTRVVVLCVLNTGAHRRLLHLLAHVHC